MHCDEMTVLELNELQKSGHMPSLLDVRNEKERNFCHLGGVFIPLPELANRFHELDKDQEWIVYCRSGGRSQQAVDLLLDAGYKAKNLKGGICAWHYEIDPNFPIY